MRWTHFVVPLLPGAIAHPASAGPSSPISIPLPDRHTPTSSNGEANIAAALFALNHTLAKYNRPPLPNYPAIATEQAALGLARRQASEPLTDQVSGQSNDVAYYGPGVVGAGDGAPQTFQFDFDTGSADVWVPARGCSGCPHPARYDAGGASQHRTTTITYGSGSVSGQDYTDDVSVAGLRAQRQTVIAVTSASGFSTLGADGICGMGFSTIAQTGSPTFFENLIAQRVVRTPEFAFYLGRAASGTAGRSELTLGGRDAAKFSGTPRVVPVSARGYWQVALDAVLVNGQSAGKATKGQAAIDTGTTLVLAPSAAASAIFNAIPGSIPVSMGSQTAYLYPCLTDKRYVPKIQFAGAAFAINPLDFNFGTVTEAFGASLGDAVLAELLGRSVGVYCLAGIFGGDINTAENLYIVGDVFLKNWYSVYSYTASGGKPAVLFAPAVGNNS